MSLLDEIAVKLSTMSDDDKADLADRIADSSVGKMLWVPNPGPQTEAFYSPADELFYGGQAGGGKSDLLLGLALEAHTVSRIFRKQHNDREALIDRLVEILGSRDGYNGGDYVWRLPKRDAVIRFGAMSSPDSWERYQGDATDFKGWDEITHFKRHEYTTVNAWLRTTKEGQRCRVVSAGNPPVTANGMWIIDYYAPWLDPDHKDPAKPGELRWFASIGDDDSVEVSEDWRGEGPAGEEITPRSRTFIPAGLADNPDLAETGYASTLMALPPHLRDALAHGVFRAKLEDTERQVIPTAWIIAAQERWELRRHEIDQSPMTALGIDMADGGRDRMVCVPLYGTVFGEPQIKPGKEVRSTGEKMAFAVSAARDDPQFNVDAGGGYGGALISSLQSNNMNVVPIKAGSASRQSEAREPRRAFANKRAELIWRFREALDPDTGDNLALPPGRQIIAELTAFRELPHAEMRQTIRIESNDEITKRLGVSPDLAWGFIFAWAEPDAITREQRRSSVIQRQERAFRRGARPVVHRSHVKLSGNIHNR